MNNPPSRSPLRRAKEGPRSKIRDGRFSIVDCRFWMRPCRFYPVYLAHPCEYLELMQLRPPRDSVASAVRFLSGCHSERKEDADAVDGLPLWSTRDGEDCGRFDRCPNALGSIRTGRSLATAEPVKLGQKVIPSRARPISGRTLVDRLIVRRGGGADHLRLQVGESEEQPCQLNYDHSVGARQVSGSPREV